MSVPRLLPWAGPEGKPCFPVTDGDGCLSRAADAVDSVQLGMAAALLDHSAALLEGRQVTKAELRSLMARMREALTDVPRIAESRRLQHGGVCQGGAHGLAVREPGALGVPGVAAPR
ncbi:hypothetical protein [Streptomyces sp. NPDC001123]